MTRNLNKTSQTEPDDFGSFSTDDFIFDLDKIRTAEGFRSVEDIQNEDINNDKWAEIIVGQLFVRDVLFTFIQNKYEKLLTCKKSLDVDIDYMKLKVLDLDQQVKGLKHKLKVKKKKLKCSFSQTEGDCHDWYSNYSWYSTYYPEYYSREGESEMKNIESHENERLADVKSAEQTISEENINIDETTTETEVVLSTSIIQSEISENNSHNNNLEDNKKLETKNNSSLNETSDLVSKTLPDTEPKNSSENEQNTTNDNAATENDSNMEVESTNQNITDTLGEEIYSNAWSSKDICKEVTDAATNFINSSSYVYCDEVGLYYDYSTGYYYDAEKSLYYDSKTGTYFYYDHTEEKYVFHSQVTPTAQPENKCKKIKEVKEFKETPSNEKEEGECTDSDDENFETQDNDSMPGPEIKYEEAIVAPSLRLMVVGEGANGSVHVGSLHVVTVDGGTLGREKSNLVYLPDLSISKLHAEITYISSADDDHHYYLKDLGSNNGTILNGNRLSDSKVVSQSVEIGHGWKIKVGDVYLACHIHPGNLTCNECEPGLVINNFNRQSKKNRKIISKSGKDNARKKENKLLRQKYGLCNKQATSNRSDEYQDRADVRRKTVGSDNPYEKTEVASDQFQISASNKGFKLLEKMGWSEGQTIGKTQSGIMEPIKVETRASKVGLGANPLENVSLTKQQIKKKKINSIMKKRFKQCDS